MIVFGERLCLKWYIICVLWSNLLYWWCTWCTTQWAVTASSGHQAALPTLGCSKGFWVKQCSHATDHTDTCRSCRGQLEHLAPSPPNPGGESVRHHIKLRLRDAPPSCSSPSLLLHPLHLEERREEKLLVAAGPMEKRRGSSRQYGSLERTEWSRETSKPGEPTHRHCTAYWLSLCIYFEPPTVNVPVICMCLIWQHYHLYGRVTVCLG